MASWDGRGRPVERRWEVAGPARGDGEQGAREGSDPRKATAKPRTRTHNHANACTHTHARTRTHHTNTRAYTLTRVYTFFCLRAGARLHAPVLGRCECTRARTHTHTCGPGAARSAARVGSRRKLSKPTRSPKSGDAQSMPQRCAWRVALLVTATHHACCNIGAPCMFRPHDIMILWMI